MRLGKVRLPSKNRFSYTSIYGGMLISVAIKEVEDKRLFIDNQQISLHDIAI